MATKKSKSIDTSPSEPPVAYVPPSQSPVIVESSDNFLNEISGDSLESASPTALTPPPAKPPRYNDESPSSSPVDIQPPPTKPPRQFSLYSTEDDTGLIQQTDTVVKKVLNLVDTFGIISDNDNDMNILRQTLPPSPPPIFIQHPPNTDEFDDENFDKAPTIDTFTVDPTRIILNTDSSLATNTLDEPLRMDPASPIFSTSDDYLFSSMNELSDIIPYDSLTPIEITKLANQLTENIFEEAEKEFEKHHLLQNLDTIISDDPPNIIDKLDTELKTSNTTVCDNIPSLPQSIATTHPVSIQSTTRPLMFVSLDSGFNIQKTVSPLVDVATVKPIPKVTTSVTVISPPEPTIPSVTTTNLNSDDEDQLNSSSTLMPNSSIASDRSKLLQSSSKESSIDSNDTNLSDIGILQPLNPGSATPARSLLSDYDNLHGSYGSLNDDTQQPPAFPSVSSELLSPTTTTTSISLSTIEENVDSLASSSTVINTANNDNTIGIKLGGQRLNSDISDEDLVESHDIETPSLTSLDPFLYSKGRIPLHHIRINTHEHIYPFLLACLGLPMFFFALFELA